jgi:hypothetical protein
MSYEECANHFNRHADEMVKLCQDAVKALCPHVCEVKFIPGEKRDFEPRIVLDDIVEIHPATLTRTTIAGERSVYGFCVIEMKYFPATFHEPEDMEEVELGDSQSVVGAAEMAVNHLLKAYTKSYWEYVETCRFAKDLEEEGYY